MWRSRWEVLDTSQLGMPIGLGFSLSKLAVQPKLGNTAYGVKEMSWHIWTGLYE